MDELLFERVKQLKEIDDRLERIEKGSRNGNTLYEVWKMASALRTDLKDMIRAAEIAHANF